MGRNASGGGGGGGTRVFDNFEQFATRRGYGMADLGDAALHRSSKNVSAAARKRQIARQDAKDREWEIRRSELRREWELGLATGRYRQRGDLDVLRKTARGHSDNESVQAARRVLEKRKARMAAMGR